MYGEGGGIHPNWPCSSSSSDDKTATCPTRLEALTPTYQGRKGSAAQRLAMASFPAERVRGDRSDGQGGGMEPNGNTLGKRGSCYECHRPENRTMPPLAMHAPLAGWLGPRWRTI